MRNLILINIEHENFMYINCVYLYYINLFRYWKLMPSYLIFILILYYKAF